MWIASAGAPGPPPQAKPTTPKMMNTAAMVSRRERTGENGTLPKAVIDGVSEQWTMQQHYTVGERMVPVR
jgi:hypothetical protein